MTIQELEQAEAFARRCYELARERADSEWHRAIDEAGPGLISDSYRLAHREMLARHGEWRKSKGALEKARKAPFGASDARLREFNQLRKESGV